MLTKNHHLTNNAQTLRKNMTREELHLWFDCLKQLPFSVHRQKVICNYIVDFYIAEAKIVIELDGSQHYEDSGKESDYQRDQHLREKGYLVLRYSNYDISQHFPAVCDDIWNHLQQRHDPSSGASRHLPPKGEGQKGSNMKHVQIYTDGACSGNPGPGGWGAILKYGEHEKNLSGGEAQTTNNRMELLGVISALEALKEPCRVELWSDSRYVIDGLSKGWAAGWRRRGWIKPDKKPALNPDLWERLLDLTAQHEMEYHWVRGHADNEYNNRCDQLAVAAREKYAG